VSAAAVTTNDPAVTQAALMMRWNAAAAAADTEGFDFGWTSYDQFPHPTYKGGSPQAYGGFANVLLLFFQSGDNFDFLARNHLFSTRLRYIFPSGQSGLDTSFQELAAFFSSPTGYGDASAETRQALQVFLDRMTP
jgi:hypothetical protein